jgi:predicted TIM-barrel fold metal-dependent hydrolase
LDLLGPERVVFGTDLPGADYYVKVGRVLELAVEDDVKQMMLAGNIERILGL